jgi:hypothetical protein
MKLQDFVTAMDSVHSAALRAPASSTRDEAVYGIQEATSWAVAVAQRGGDIAPAAVVERACNAARLFARVRVRAEYEGGDVEAAIRDAFAVAGWRL